jgi:hypothetical protein
VVDSSASNALVSNTSIIKIIIIAVYDIWKRNYASASQRSTPGVTSKPSKNTETTTPDALPQSELEEHRKTLVRDDARHASGFSERVILSSAQ